MFVFKLDMNGCLTLTRNHISHELWWMFWMGVSHVRTLLSTWVKIVKTLFLLLCQIEERVARDKPFWENTLLRLDMMAMVSLSRQKEGSIEKLRIFAFLMKNGTILVSFFCSLELVYGISLLLIYSKGVVQNPLFS